jgi:hypothetical protein
MKRFDKTFNLNETTNVSSEPTLFWPDSRGSEMAKNRMPATLVQCLRAMTTLWQRGLEWRPLGH